MVGRARPGPAGLAFALLACFAAPTAGLAGPAGDPRVSPGEVLVLGADPGTTGVLPTAESAAQALREIARAAGLSVRAVERVAASPDAFPGGAWVVRYGGNLDPAAAALLVGADPSVRYAGPNHLIPLAAYAPDDPLYAGQEALRQVRAAEAWQWTRGAGVLIAIIDTGLDRSHPDLVDRVAVNAEEAGGLPGVDDDGNGYVDDVAGYDFTDAPGLPGLGDFVGRDADPSDDHGHGTAVAGVAAATGNNGTGMIGVAPEATLLGLRAGLRTSLPLLSAVLQEDDAAAAIVYAVDQGADILNLSWGDIVDAPVVREAIRYAHARGVLVVASAGNEGTDAAFYPAAYPGVLSVGASGSGDERALFSVFGPDLDLLAPGIAVQATAPGGEYPRLSGTSFSAPLAAGAAALVQSLHPEWTADQVAWKLRHASRRRAAGWTADAGWGALDAARATDPAAPGAPPLADILEARRAGDDGWVLTGTVAGAGLLDWSLDVVDAGGTSQRLVERSERQVVGDTLACWDDGGAAPGEAILRIAARFGGTPEVESRLRIPVPASPPPAAGEPAFEFQATVDRGWDLAAWWRTAARVQGGLELPDPPFPRRVEEAATRTAHAARIPGPLPPGPLHVRVVHRSGRDAAWSVALDTVLVAPETPEIEPAPRLADAPAGAPFARAVDFDGDLLPEVIVESPPASGFYGFLAVWELRSDGMWEAVPGAPTDLYGIPVDVGDPDGDGLQDLLLYRHDAWGLYEAREGGAFPSRLRLSLSGDAGVPLGFVPGGRVVAAVSDGVLDVYRPAGDGWILDETVPNYAPGAPPLLPGGATGDFDGDGAGEIAVSDQSGNVVLYRVEADAVRWLGAWRAPRPPSPPFLRVPGPDGRDDLWTLERVPGAALGEGELERAALFVRRWTHDGAGLAALDALPLAGAAAPASARIAPLADGGLVLHAGGVHRLVADPAAAAPVWAGSPIAAAAAEGLVHVPQAAPSGGRIWLGTLHGEPGALYGGPPATEVVGGGNSASCARPPARRAWNSNWHGRGAGRSSSAPSAERPRRRSSPRTAARPTASPPGRSRRIGSPAPAVPTARWRCGASLRPDCYQHGTEIMISYWTSIARSRRDGRRVASSWSPGARSSFPMRCT